MTFCDENVTSHLFVTVPHSNPGPGSGKFSARNDLQLDHGAVANPFHGALSGLHPQTLEDFVGAFTTARFKSGKLRRIK